MIQVAWAPAVCFSHPRALPFRTNTLKTRSEGLGRGWLRQGTALCRQTAVPAKPGLWRPQRTRGRGARPASGGEAKPMLPSLSSLGKEGGPGDRRLLLLLAESPQNCAPQRHTGPGHGILSKEKGVLRSLEIQMSKMASWLGTWLFAALSRGGLVPSGVRVAMS